MIFKLRETFDSFYILYVYNFRHSNIFSQSMEESQHKKSNETKISIHAGRLFYAAAQLYSTIGKEYGEKARVCWLCASRNFMQYLDQNTDSPVQHHRDQVIYIRMQLFQMLTFNFIFNFLCIHCSYLE